MSALRMWSEPDEARMWLLCLPPGGGAAHLYRGWADRLPAALGVAALELPGHGSRGAEPAARDAAQLVAALAADAAPLIGRPTVLFGHSMGAVLALDLARRLRAERGWQPAALIAAASGPGPDPGTAPAALLKTAALFDTASSETAKADEQLRAWGGTAPELLGDREFLATLAPVLRADLDMMARRVSEPAAPLDCPVHLYAGADDPGVDPHAAARQWARQTTAAHSLRIFAGGHFFLAQAEDEVLAALVEDADAAVGGALPRATRRAAR